MRVGFKRLQSRLFVFAPMSSQQFIDSQLKGLTNRVLHAHNFSKASSKALDVAVDLLSRYLELLAATCASFAQHAGRDAANVHDALMALEELGLDMNDIMEWCERDGIELAKYAGTTSRTHLEQFGCEYSLEFS